MAETLRGHVLSHWSKLFENFQTSSLDFYVRVGTAVQRRQAPGISISRVTWRESGILSARREYLRIERDEHVFDICAAPFGTGFFFSSWLAEARSRYGWLYGIIVIVLTLIVNTISFILFTLVFGDYQPQAPGEAFTWLLFVIIFSFVWLVVSFAIATWLAAWLFGVRAVLDIPVLGRLYNWLFRPITYYRLDTAQMFQKTVHNAVMEAIDELTTAKGLRSLSEDERKPVMREFVDR